MIHLVQRVELWIPTWQGWLLLAIAVCLAGAATIRGIYPFLAISQPRDADIAIVEGWIPDEVLKVIVDDLHAYRLVITTGFPVYYGRYLSGYEDFAQVAADTLILFGLAPEKVIPVPYARVERDRTLRSALGVQEWLTRTQIDVRSVNLYSLGPHARRSWLLFQQALRPTQVGIIAINPQEYNSRQWWSTSSGTRQVLSEGIGYLYARLVHWSR